MTKFQDFIETSLNASFLRELADILDGVHPGDSQISDALENGQAHFFDKISDYAFLEHVASRSDASKALSAAYHLCPWPIDLPYKEAAQAADVLEKGEDVANGVRAVAKAAVDAATRLVSEDLSAFGLCEAVRAACQLRIQGLSEIDIQHPLSGNSLKLARPLSTARMIMELSNFLAALAGRKDADDEFYAHEYVFVEKSFTTSPQVVLDTLPAFSEVKPSWSAATLFGGYRADSPLFPYFIYVSSRALFDKPVPSSDLKDISVATSLSVPVLSALLAAGDGGYFESAEFLERFSEAFHALYHWSDAFIAESTEDFNRK